MVRCWYGRWGLGCWWGCGSDYDFQWATIGDPGNRETRDDELGFFAQVYHPYYTRNTGNVLGFSDFTGGDIRLAFGEIMINNGVSPDKPIDLGWEYAARYVNWLHNGKVNEE